MTNRENFISLVKRRGYEKVPIDFKACPSLTKKFNEYIEETGFSFKKSCIDIPDLTPRIATREDFLNYYPHSFKDGTRIDRYGVAHEPGSAAAFHMTKMYHPMNAFDSEEQVSEYPFPDYVGADPAKQIDAIKRAHDGDLIAIGNMQCTVWERAWYMRGMENLMTDMMMDDPIANAVLDRVTEISVMRAESFVKNGVDVLFLGDDIGMQHSIMMSENMYCEWLKPRLKRVIDAARAINPEIIVFYHSCGFVTPMIPHLIEAGIDVLDPVQPECMNFADIHAEFGDRLSFHGTIGTQTTMPFGTPDDVRREVFKNLETAGDRGGLLVAPTHLLEPEVPVENLVAYINACRDVK
jgi:uroporphyrinogen decarboxylase